MGKRKKNQTPQAVKANGEGRQPWREFRDRLYRERSLGAVSDAEEMLFRDALSGFDRDPVCAIDELLEKLERYLSEGQTQQALLEVARSVALLSAKVNALATVLERYRPALGKEFRRMMGKEQHNVKRQERKEAQKRLARELWAEFDDADLRQPGGAATVYKQIGEIIAQRLGLPKPIQPDTIRKYLAE